MTKDALTTLEENLINYNKLVVEKLEKRIQVEDEEFVSITSMSGSASKVMSIDEGSQEGTVDNEEGSKDGGGGGATTPTPTP